MPITKSITPNGKKSTASVVDPLIRARIAEVREKLLRSGCSTTVPSAPKAVQASRPTIVKATPKPPAVSTKSEAPNQPTAAITSKKGDQTGYVVLREIPDGYEAALKEAANRKEIRRVVPQEIPVFRSLVPRPLSPPYALTEEQFDQNASLSNNKDKLLVNILSPLTSEQKRIVLDFQAVFKDNHTVALQIDLEERFVDHFMGEHRRLLACLAYNELLKKKLSKADASKELDYGYITLDQWNKWYQKHREDLQDWTKFYGNANNAEIRGWPALYKSFMAPNSGFLLQQQVNQKS